MTSMDNWPINMKNEIPVENLNKTIIYNTGESDHKKKFTSTSKLPYKETSDMLFTKSQKLIEHEVSMTPTYMTKTPNSTMNLRKPHKAYKKF